MGGDAARFFDKQHPGGMIPGRMRWKRAMSLRPSTSRG
jgi:hypothetical protein